MHHLLASLGREIEVRAFAAVERHRAAQCGPYIWFPTYIKADFKGHGH